MANFSQFREDPTTVTEDGIDINKVETALKTVDVELLNTKGEMKDLGVVIDQLGLKWDGLDRNTRAYLATTIAGNRLYMLAVA